MSGGYLQRLVTAVVGGGDSIRPRTGSIFSPHREELNPPLHGWEEADTVTAVQPQVDAPSLEGERRPAQQVRPKSEHVSLVPSTIEPDSQSTDRAVPSLFAALRPDARAVGPHDESEAEPSRSRLSPESGFGPLITSNGFSRSGAALAEPRPLPQERTSRAERQADDIQIHIGRIEVTAVRSAALPAPKAPDRSLSLDAYLNRRNGRAR
jgi:hypothetical protein